MIDFDVPIPNPSGLPARIARPRAGETISAILVGDERCSVILHWDGERSVPHHQPRKECGYCNRGCPQKGIFLYLAAWRWDTKSRIILELSTYTVGNHWPVLNRMPTELHGRKISVSRPKDRPRSSLKVDLGEVVRGAEHLEVWSVREALQVIWFGPAKSRKDLYDTEPTVIPFGGEIPA